MKQIYLKGLVIIGFLSLACTTKVSEWVLLNAIPNQYTLVYFHNNPLTESVRKQNASLDASIKHANIQLKNVGEDDIKQPYYALYYGNRLFGKYNNIQDLKNLTTSPLREKIATELLAGKLSVLLYLTTDNKSKDEKGMQVIRNVIKSSPFGEIISVIELPRNSVDEAHFASLLLNVEDDLKNINEPMLFGIFGRFKALEPILGAGITEENINLLIDFLTSDCSCLIKDDLPGTDILFTNAWDAPAPALVNKILDENPSLVHN